MKLLTLKRKTIWRPRFGALMSDFLQYKAWGSEPLRLPAYEVRGLHAVNAFGGKRFLILLFKGYLV